MAGTHYLIGVDTGGTYTDAAVLDAASCKVLATAKALTTRGDLSDGQLYALKLTDLTDDEQVWSSSTYEAKVGAFEWVALDMDLWELFPLR